MSDEEIAGRDSRLADEVDSPAISHLEERVSGDMSGITDTPAAAAAGVPPTMEDTANSRRSEEDTVPPPFRQQQQGMYTTGEPSSYSDEQPRAQLSFSSPAPIPAMSGSETPVMTRGDALSQQFQNLAFSPAPTEQSSGVTIPQTYSGLPQGIPWSPWSPDPNPGSPLRHGARCTEPWGT